MQNINNGTDLQKSDKDTAPYQGNAARDATTPTISNPHQALWQEIASVGASHDAGQQSERGGCIEGTCEPLLKIINDWTVGEGENAPICWLSGVVGVGKSAIAMTVAKRCEAEGRLVSSFFFSRHDLKRNNPSSLVLTIASGLASTIPSIRSPIEQRISNDPTILADSLEDQFRELISKPVQALTWTSQFPNIVVIDELDACGDEETQLRILSTIQLAYHETPSFPLRFLICSRGECWIHEAFDAHPLRQLSKVVLVYSSETEKDILRYYRHHFQEIVESPRYTHIQFPSLWPSEDVVEQLAEQSSSQFARASNVVRFIKLEDRDPQDQLRIVQEHAFDSTSSPYIGLDAQYTDILGRFPDIDEGRQILAAIVILPSQSPACIELVLGLPPGQVGLALRGLHSVLDVRGQEDEIRFYHTSFRDYLVDSRRSGRFHIDFVAQIHEIAQAWLRNLSSRTMGSYSPDQIDKTNGFFTDWVGFCSGSLPRPTQDVLDELRNVDLAAVFFCRYRYRAQEAPPSERETVDRDWRELYGQLVSWVAEADNADDLVHKFSNPPQM
ncbi:hypothetical protein PM082_020950 [Marasmius tenuissimus]|nr:hypothetical protein PM082_020950 [Marasmius tenuissimus]